MQLLHSPAKRDNQLWEGTVFGKSAARAQTGRSLIAQSAGLPPQPDRLLLSHQPTPASLFKENIYALHWDSFGMLWYGIDYTIVWWKWPKMLTSEPAVRFSLSFFPRYRQDSTKTLSQVWYGLVWYSWVKMPENAIFWTNDEGNHLYWCHHLDFTPG